MLSIKKHPALLLLLFIAFALNVQAQVEKNGTIKKDSLSVDTSNKWHAVEIEASVNVAEWRHHLQIQLPVYIEKAAAKGMKAGTYTVNVRFLIEKDGSINNVKALNDPGYGLAEGVVKVVTTGPKWSPGEQNGKKIRSYHTQPITFTISNQ